MEEERDTFTPEFLEVIVLVGCELGNHKWRPSREENQTKNKITENKKLKQKCMEGREEGRRREGEKEEDGKGLKDIQQFFRRIVEGSPWDWVWVFPLLGTSLISIEVSTKNINKI